MDFFIAQKRIVIEIDGAQHGFEEILEKDCKRDSDLIKLGITVLRYTNKDINQNFNSVCKNILTHLNLDEENIKF